MSRGRPTDGQTNPLTTIMEEESGETKPYPIRTASRRNKPEDYKVVVVEERKSWANKLEYMLATVGFTIGFGNIWRFPYLCQKNGGGAFLIPYGVSLLLLGIPLFYLELALGQSLRQGSIGVWNAIHPYLGGVGIASVVVCLLIGTYYNMILAWCFYYLFASFQDPLPYSECPKLGNATLKGCDPAAKTQYYWYHKTLAASESIEEFGDLQWHLCLCLLLAWLAVFICIMRGVVRSLGKAVYVTGTLPVIVLGIFFGRSITMEGSVDGIIHLFKPKFERLLDPEIWLDGATQVFYSLGIGLGSLIAMSSYNRRHNNCRRDAILVSVVDTLVSIFASVVVFSVIGFQAHHSLSECRSQYAALNNTNISLEEKCFDLEHWLSLSAQGPGLTFIAFTEAIAKMPISPLWAVLFFSMLVTLGLGSMFGVMEGVVTPIYDMKLFTWRKEILTGVFSVFSFLVGLLFCQRSGEYWLQLFDLSCGNLPLLFIAFVEIVGVCYIYGASRLEADIEYMLGDTPGLYWRVMWRFVSPLIVLVIFVASLINMGINRLTYTAWDSKMGDVVKLKYPFWGYIVIPSLACISCAFIPIMFCLRCTGLMKYKQKPQRIYLI